MSVFPFLAPRKAMVKHEQQTAKQLPSSSSALRSSLSIHSSTLKASGHASPHCLFKIRSAYTRPQTECTLPHGLNGLKKKRLQELKELNVQKLDITTTRPQEKQVPIYTLKPSLLRDIGTHGSTRQTLGLKKVLHGDTLLPGQLPPQPIVSPPPSRRVGSGNSSSSSSGSTTSSSSSSSSSSSTGVWGTGFF